MEQVVLSRVKFTGGAPNILMTARNRCLVANFESACRGRVARRRPNGLYAIAR